MAGFRVIEQESGTSALRQHRYNGYWEGDFWSADASRGADRRPRIMHQKDLVIVGGGQAGLAASYWARQRNIDHVVLDAGQRSGETWRHRYDSLTLFTPRRYSRLPGLDLAGDPEGHPGKDEIADYLEEYAAGFGLPVLHESRVQSITHEAAVFQTATATETWAGPLVIIATGPFHTPRSPAWASELRDVRQVHSSEYRSAGQVVGDRVAVVGGGNSGAQIAEELSDAGFRVTWAVSERPRHVPQRLLGRSAFWWLDHAGFLEAPAGSVRARILRRRGDPIFGTRVARLVDAGRIRQAPTAVSPTDGGLVFADGSREAVDTVIWCTGFAPDFALLRIHDVVGATGAPVHDRGVSTVVSGLGFAGLAWQRSRNSALLGGAGTDARQVIDALLAQQASTSGWSRPGWLSGTG